jgi:hypothetical protein
MKKLPFQLPVIFTAVFAWFFLPAIDPSFAPLQVKCVVTFLAGFSAISAVTLIKNRLDRAKQV